MGAGKNDNVWIGTLLCGARWIHSGDRLNQKVPGYYLSVRLISFTINVPFHDRCETWEDEVAEMQ